MFLSLLKKYNLQKITEERKKCLKNHAQEYQIPISSFELWDVGLTHISHNNSEQLSYERLEFLGDSVLGLCLAHLLFDKFSDLSEGKMSAIKSHVVSEKTLAQVGIELGLLKIVKLGNGERLKDNRAQEKVLCDLFESTLATIFLQHGLKKSCEFIDKLFLPRIDTIFSEGLSDYKTRLQKIVIKVYKEYPQYEIIDTEGPAHGKIFTVKGEVIKDEVVKFSSLGKGRTKKEAEQKVACDIILQIEKYAIEHDDSVLTQILLNSD